MGIVVSPEINDANRDVNLRMDDPLGGQLLHHAPGSEFVVLSMHQLARHGLEGFYETGEVSELVEGFSFRPRYRRCVVALAQLNERGGGDSAFEVKMQLGLGKAADERLNIVHISSLLGASSALVTPLG